MSASETQRRAAVSTGLLELWARILNKAVGPQDDFFDSGGDSMSAVRMIMDVQSTYGVEIDVETFFEAASVERLTEAVLAASPAGSPAPRAG